MKTRLNLEQIKSILDSTGSPDYVKEVIKVAEHSRFEDGFACAQFLTEGNEYLTDASLSEVTNEGLIFTGSIGAVVPLQFVRVLVKWDGTVDLIKWSNSAQACSAGKSVKEFTLPADLKFIGWRG